MPAREAWAACGEPNGPAGIQNIRKRARLQREQAAASPAPEVIAVEVSRGTPGAPVDGEALAVVQAVGSAAKTPNRQQPAFRLKPDQVMKAKQVEMKMKAAFDEIYKKATQEYADVACDGRPRRGETSADAIAARYAAQLPAECKTPRHPNS